MRLLPPRNCSRKCLAVSFSPSFGSVDSRLSEIDASSPGTGAKWKRATFGELLGAGKDAPGPLAVRPAGKENSTDAKAEGLRFAELPLLASSRESVTFSFLFTPVFRVKRKKGECRV